jgi:hypothetical protein
MTTAAKTPISSEKISRIVMLARETTHLDVLADIETTIDKLTALSRNFRKNRSDFCGV